MSLRAGDWAAWVQAVGSIAAICAGFGTVYWQSRKAEELRKQDRALSERDRHDRADVVAFRLSGWLSEVGSRVQEAWDRYDLIRKHNPIERMPQPFQQVAVLLKLNVVVGIENVMSDLHYLEVGTGDVAQLDYHVQFFEAFLDMALERGTLSHGDLVAFYGSVERQLTNMRQLHADAQRHLAPIIEAAVARER